MSETPRENGSGNGKEGGQETAPALEGVHEAGEQAPPASVSPGKDAWRRLLKNPVAVVSGLYILLIILLSLGANFIAPYDYAFQDTHRYVSLPADPDRHHRLGTDDLGRDIVSRVIYGARVSLGVTAIVVTVECLVGISFGLWAGFFGGRTDNLLMRITDVMFAFPDLLLAILISGIIRAGAEAISPLVSLGTLFFALGITGWPGMARLVRGQALALREKEYIEAARATGVKNGAIMLRHLLPNISGPIIVQVTQDIAGVILAESTLSFLGLGVQPPYPSWGRMINEALAFKESRPLLLLVPSLTLALTVMAFNFFGDALRDALDPRLRQ
jgi:ABC-type dipeptide/oligopeptide/nickel transport system permease subunit